MKKIIINGKKYYYNEREEKFIIEVIKDTKRNKEGKIVIKELAQIDFIEIIISGIIFKIAEKVWKEEIYPYIKDLIFENKESFKENET